MVYEICKICGRFFGKNGRELCDKCYEKNKKEYAAVKEYILKHRGATAMEVINATGVSMKTIMRYVEEGTLAYGEEGIDILEQDGFARDNNSRINRDYYRR